MKCDKDFIGEKCPTGVCIGEREDVIDCFSLNSCPSTGETTIECRECQFSSCPSNKCLMAQGGEICVEQCSQK